jgi:hypothetical protein
MKKKQKKDFQIGDSVYVVAHTQHSYIDECNMGGWHGRVVELTSEDLKDEYTGDERIVTVEFDSITQQAMPVKFLLECIDEEIEFYTECLEISELLPWKARDTVEDTKAAIDEIYEKISFMNSLDEDEKIRLCLLHCGLELRPTGLHINYLPYFVKSMSKKTKQELLHLLKEEAGLPAGASL